MAMRSRVCFALVGLVLIASRAFAAPGAATLRSPNGIVTSTTIAFTWDAVPESSWYQFWLGTSSPSALIQAQWYTAAQAGCASGGTCTITLTPPIGTGGHVWFIQTWGGENGPWSTGLAFTFRDTPTWSRTVPAQQRFTLVMDDLAVLDNETGLTWIRAPSSSTMQWSSTALFCTTTSTGARLGWRVPEVHELGSLFGFSGATVMPAGHPFTGFSGRFWTRTTVPGGTNVLTIEFVGNTGIIIGPVAPSDSYRVWCVRGPAR